MARIAGIEMPADQPIRIALTRFRGIGAVHSKRILDRAGVPGTKKVKDLTEAQLGRVLSAIPERFKEPRSFGTLNPKGPFLLQGAKPKRSATRKRHVAEPATASEIRTTLGVSKRDQKTVSKILRQRGLI